VGSRVKIRNRKSRIGEPILIRHSSLSIGGVGRGENILDGGHGTTGAILNRTKRELDVKEPPQEREEVMGETEKKSVARPRFGWSSLRVVRGVRERSCKSAWGNKTLNGGKFRTGRETPNQPQNPGRFIHGWMGLSLTEVTHQDNHNLGRGYDLANKIGQGG